MDFAELIAYCQGVFAFNMSPVILSVMSSVIFPLIFSVIFSVRSMVQAIQNKAATIFMLVALLLSSYGAVAQRPLDIIVTVNQTPLTQYDVDSRLALHKLLGESFADPDSARRHAIDTLIDEAVYLNFAAANGLSPSDNAVSLAFENLAARNGLSLDEFKAVLKNSGTDVTAFRENLRAQLAWNNILASSARGQTEVSDEEFEAEWSRIQAAKGQSERYLSEIYLPKGSYEEALNLVDRIRGGDSMEDLAREVSASPSAAQGGRMGWVRDGELPSATVQALRQVQAGQVSDPIAGPNGGYFIYGVQQVRPVGSLGVRETYDLGRLFVTLDSQGQSQSDAEKLITLEQVFRSVDSCARFDQATQIYGEGDSGRLDDVAAADLSQAVRDAIQPLGNEQFSQLVPEDGGVAIYIKCDSKVVEIPQTEDGVREQLRQEKLTEFGATLRTQLRSQAYIEYE